MFSWVIIYVKVNVWQATVCTLFGFDIIPGYLYFITAPFTNLPLNYTAQSRLQLPAASMFSFFIYFFTIKDSLRGRRCFIGVGACHRSLRRPWLSVSVTASSLCIWQHTSAAATGITTSLFSHRRSHFAIGRVSVSPYAAICPPAPCVRWSVLLGKHHVRPSEIQISGA